MLSPSRPSSSAIFARNAKWDRGLLIDWRDTHQASDIELQFIATHLDERLGVRRHDTRLLFLLAGVDLNEELEPFALLVHLGGNCLAILGRSTLWMASKRATASRVLLDCSGPIRCNSRPG